MNLLNNINKKFEIIIYITLGSIFVSDFKIYIPLFACNILYIAYMIYKKELTLNLKGWNKSLILFLLWFFINSIIAILILKFKVSFSLGVKLVLNLTFLSLMGIFIEQSKIVLSKKNFLNFLKIIILINFIQIISIYFTGDLFKDLILGNLTKSSDAAYTIGQYKNIIGGTNKNIWASKYVLIYIIYIFTCVDDNFKYLQNIKSKLFYIIIGAITAVLMLSRTAQLAIIIPILFLAFYSIRNIDKKYKNIIYLISIICSLVILIIFFDKMFHIKFDMSDGGYTRIFIWRESFKNLFENNYILGEGISSSGYYIQNIIGRHESNMHNVFFNTLYEFGLIGLGIYVKFLYDFAKKYFINKNIIKYIFIIIIPFLIIINLQYLGYDNDMVVFMILIIILNKFTNNNS